MSKAILKHNVKTSEITNKLTSLLNRTVDAEKEAKAAVLQSNLSTKQSKEIAVQFESQGREAYYNPSNNLPSSMMK